MNLDGVELWYSARLRQRLLALSAGTGHFHAGGRIMALIVQ
jgi:hypothetical protein